RGFPYQKVEGESEDDPHHTGVFFTFDMINGNIFWGSTEKPPEIRHIKVEEMTPGNGKGVLKTLMHWIGVTGLTMLEEKRTMEFIPGESENIVDFTMTLTAKDTTVVFHDTKEGMFAIRVADWLREDGGTGKYLSSEGEETEKNVWGKKAKWMRLQGEKDGKVFGISILNHPTSIYYPTYWHARAYGLFAANPLGQEAFQSGRGMENPVPYNLTLKPGESALFRFRMIFYEGDRTADQIEEVFNQYSQ
ncbi:PmoA family protein, partial [bacterium]|nr:PmoA family protein [bacterium]